MVSVGTAIGRVLTDAAGCEVAFLVIATPVTHPDNGLMFTNAVASDLEAALEAMLQVIRSTRQQKSTQFTPPNPSTRTH